MNAIPHVRFAIPLTFLLMITMIKPAAGGQFATAKDGTRIAYDVTGSGPAVILLHGGGQTRRVWHDLGYVSRLAGEFTVVTLDLRGNGESDKPTQSAAYAIDRLTEDVLAVADQVKAERFAIWGFSYGANIGRYLAARSDRVRSMIYIGIPFGAAAQGVFRTRILELQGKWTPIIEAAAKGQLDLGKLSPEDRAAWERGAMPVTIAWLSAMLDYPPVEPADLKCPTLWLVGTANEGTMESVKVYREKLSGSKVALELVDGLTHPQELQEIERVFPKEVEFTRSHR